MSLAQMAFTKNWENPVDFPTYEPNEEQVRADMQYLFDEIKACYNKHINNEFVASNLVFAPIEGVQATNVQDAIAIVYAAIAEAYEGSIVDGAVTASKLCQVDGSEAVVTNAIRDGAVTTDKIADGAITADKLDSNITFDVSNLADGSIQQAKLANGAVGTDKIENYAVTSVKIENGAVNTNQLHDGAVTIAKTSGIQKIHNIIGPISVATTAWNSTTKKATVTVTGVSLTNAGTQKVDWTPADRATWTSVRDNGVWVLRVPPANNQVTLECEKIPSSALSLYFCIWD